jgi:hypothetical protein
MSGSSNDVVIRAPFTSNILDIAMGLPSGSTPFAGMDFRRDPPYGRARQRYFAESPQPKHTPIAGRSEPDSQCCDQQNKRGDTVTLCAAHCNAPKADPLPWSVADLPGRAR